MKLILTLVIIASAIIPALSACNILECLSREDAGKSTSQEIMIVKERVLSIVSQIDPGRPQTLARAEEITTLEGPLVPSLIQLLKEGDVLTRWAAIYSLDRISQRDPHSIPLDVITFSLGDPDLSIRVRAAALFHRLGDPRGRSILEQAAKVDRRLKFSHPPILISDFAQWALGK